MGKNNGLMYKKNLEKLGNFREGESRFLTITIGMMHILYMVFAAAVASFLED